MRDRAVHRVNGSGRVCLIAAAAAVAAVAAAACTGAGAGTGAGTGTGTAAADDQRPRRQYTIEQFMSTGGLDGASFSADESRILFSWKKTGIYNAYTVPVGGGEPTPITTSTTDSIYALSFFRTDDRILYMRDRGGNELYHIYVRTPDGQERDLTPGESLQSWFVNWAPDGTAFYLMSNERDARFFDVYRYDAASYARTLVYKNEQGYLPGTVSGDGTWVSLTKERTKQDTDVYVWNVETRQMTHISPHTGIALYKPAAFDSDSSHLYYLTDDGSEFTRVRRYALKTGTHEDVQRADWDITSVSFSRSGRYRVTSVNEDSRTTTGIVDTRTNTPVAVPAPIPGSTIGSVTIARSDARMTFNVIADRMPEDLYVHDFGAARATRLTNTQHPAIDPEDLVDTQVVRFPSFDAMTIPAILYKPHQATPQRKAPALVYVHGGPGGQAIRQYNEMHQYLANQGYVVLSVNNRGSSGYGKTFVAADDQKHGKDPLWDCVEAKKYLAGLPYVDASRIGIIGSSYGGYMVLAALAFQPDVFAVGVDMFGIANWPRTLESMPAWWEWQRAALHQEIGNPATQQDMLRAISPLFHADRMRKPLLVLQGANDARVPRAESDDIVAAVKRNGVPVEYVVFWDEGHGFMKKQNQIDGYGAVLRFLDTHLKGARPPQ